MIILLSVSRCRKNAFGARISKIFSWVDPQTGPN